MKNNNKLFEWCSRERLRLSAIPWPPASKAGIRNCSEDLGESTATGPVPLVIFHQTHFLYSNL